MRTTSHVPIIPTKVGTQFLLPLKPLPPVGTTPVARINWVPTFVGMIGA